MNKTRKLLGNPMRINCKTKGSHSFILFEIYFIFIYYYFFFCFLVLHPTEACGISQGRDQIGAVAAGLFYVSHSHSNAGSDLCLLPTPQLTTMLDP